MANKLFLKIKNLNNHLVKKKINFLIFLKKLAKSLSINYKEARVLRLNGKKIILINLNRV